MGKIRNITILILEKFNNNKMNKIRNILSFKLIRKK